MRAVILPPWFVISCLSSLRRMLSTSAMSFVAMCSSLASSLSSPSPRTAARFESSSASISPVLSVSKRLKRTRMRRISSSLCSARGLCSPLAYSHSKSAAYRLKIAFDSSCVDCVYHWKNSRLSIFPSSFQSSVLKSSMCLPCVFMKAVSSPISIIPDRSESIWAKIFSMITTSSSLQSLSGTFCDCSSSERCEDAPEPMFQRAARGFPGRRSQPTLSPQQWRWLLMH